MSTSCNNSGIHRSKWFLRKSYQSNLPEIGKKIAYKANRDGVAERFPEPAGQQSIAVDLALLGHDDQLLRDVELSILTTAKQLNAQTLYLRRTVPGIGAMLRLGLLDEIHEIARFPRVHDCLSSCRLVKGTKEAAGKRYGTSGTKIGNAHLTWACSEAAGLLLRAHPAGQQSLTTLEKTHGSGKALPLLGQKLGRAVYDRFQRQTAFAMGTFLNGSGSGADVQSQAIGSGQQGLWAPPRSMTQRHTPCRARHAG